MRDLKFRAWDKQTRKMVPRFVIPILNDGYVTCGGMGENVVVSRLRQGDIMQYTGLKDKNEVDIYEGDIIEARNHELYYIKWNELEASFTWAWYALDSDGKLYESAGSDGTNWALQVGSWQVIGNIYENPELLQSPTTHATQNGEGA